jgi:hypothetical protein
MAWQSEESRFQLISIFLWIEGILLLVWWPLSHWFYADMYHKLLGFEKGSYPDAMVKIIGTCGFIIVSMFFFGAKNPRKNRDIIICIILFAFLISLTYVYLIMAMGFPKLEYINVAISISSLISLLVIYPWKAVRTNME